MSTRVETMKLPEENIETLQKYYEQRYLGVASKSAGNKSKTQSKG